jgi:hypothetical protein
MRFRNVVILSTVLAAGLFGLKSIAEAKGLDRKAVVPQIEITSFGPVDSRATNRLAEVCGQVTGISGDFLAVRIEPDYGTSNAANYMTFVTKDGRFCQLIMTLYGTVRVSTVSTAQKTPVEATAKMTQTLE